MTEQQQQPPPPQRNVYLGSSCLTDNNSVHLNSIQYIYKIMIEKNQQTKLKYIQLIEVFRHNNKTPLFHLFVACFRFDTVFHMDSFIFDYNKLGGELKHKSMLQHNSIAVPFDDDDGKLFSIHKFFSNHKDGILNTMWIHFVR